MPETPQPDPTPSVFMSIPVDQINPSPYQARKTFNPDRLKDLAQSIEQEGLLEPIIVRKVGTAYELIVGERRLRAFKLLGRTSIEAKVIETVSEGEAAVKGLLENLQREDINPVEEARGFRTLMDLDQNYWNQEQLAKVTGKTQSYISESLALLTLPEPVQGFIARAILTRSHAELLARLPTHDLQITTAQAIQKRQWTVRQTEKEVKRLLGKDAKTRSAAGASTSPTDPLADYWKACNGHADLKGVTPWKVEHAPGEWNFRLKAPDAAAAAKVVEWFQKMTPVLTQIWQQTDPMATMGADALAGQAFLAGQAPQAQAMGTSLVPKRVPHTAAERAELEALASEGPGPVYAWLYGPEHPLAVLMTSSKWEDFGLTDPVEACRQIMANLGSPNKLT